MKHIFVTGGVISGVGKGVTTASMAAILIDMGYKVTIKKLDPYLNIDPGTMNPVEHGEVFVTNDGAETDLDLGYYERFTDTELTRDNSISSGRILERLLKKERAGDFLGKTVQINPHMIDLIKDFMVKPIGKEDVILCEVGGSAGDIEAAPFLEAIRQLKTKDPSNVILATVVYMVYYKASKEIKTKPAQVALTQFREKGLVPNIVFARSDYDLSDGVLKKLAKFSGIPDNHILRALNVPTIYEVPLRYVEEGIVGVMNDMGIKTKNKPTMKKWHDLNKRIQNAKGSVTIGFVGKYLELEDAYYSVIEALNSAAWHLGTNVKFKWINVRSAEDIYTDLAEVDGIIVPGGFGTSGIELLIKTITFARINQIPFMGICFGMQLSCVEFARNVLGIKNASGSEFGKEGDTFIVDLIRQWQTDKGVVVKREKGCDLGGTLRLGAYEQKLKPKTLIHNLYGKGTVYERHRHRYEVDIKFKDKFEKAGLIFSGMSPDGKLPEMIELDQKLHPFFIAMQGHPEFKSTPFVPRPFFIGLIAAAIKHKSSSKSYNLPKSGRRRHDRLLMCPNDRRRSSMIG